MSPPPERPAPVPAEKLSSQVQIPAPVVPIEFRLARPSGLSAFELGPSGDTRPFSVPPIQQHALLIALQICQGAEARIGDMERHGPAMAGGVGIVPAGYPTRWRICSGTAHHINLYVDPSIVARFAVEALDIEPATARLDPSLRLDDADPLIAQLGIAAASAIRQGDVLDLLYVEAVGQVLALHLIRSYMHLQARTVPLRGGLAPHVIKRVLDFIASEPANDLTLARLASMANLSPYHFARLFRATMGKPVHQYVMEQRLEKGLRLVMDGRLSLSEISSQLGFADQSHFSHRFKRLFHITPGALRKESKNLPRSEQGFSIQDPCHDVD